MKDYKQNLKDALYAELVPDGVKEWIEENFPELVESEDERMVKFIKNQLFNIKKTITENYELDTKLTKAIDWLEKQGQTFTQEWSGGDEAHLHSLITHLEQWIERHPNTTGADIQGENIAWLKSLRPQNTWKPSDEQMKALNEAIYHVDDSIATQIAMLIGDLKKL